MKIFFRDNIPNIVILGLLLGGAISLSAIHTDYQGLIQIKAFDTEITIDGRRPFSP